MPIWSNKKKQGSVEPNEVEAPKVSPVPAARTSAKKEPSTKGSVRAPPPAPVPDPYDDDTVRAPKLVFHCQQAQGSPTGIISGFTNIAELYQKIAEAYDFPPTEILFCTLNTHKVDMNKLLGGQIGLDDFIFAHRKGQPKELDVTKSEDALGLTITDNGAGYAFIKRIKEGSVMDRNEYIKVGDHIERIDDTSLVGWRHFEVAKFLKEIPKGTTFTIRLVEPLKPDFDIAPRKGFKSTAKQNVGCGKKTIRFNSSGPATIEVADDHVQIAVDQINDLMESFLGINDTELANQIWDIGQTQTNTIDFCNELNNSPLSAFGFSDDFLFDLWGVISDGKAGRLKAK